LGIFSTSYWTTSAIYLPAAPESRIDDRLDFGIQIEKELSKGQKHRYTFSLEAGQFTQAVVEQMGIDVLVSILAMDGKQVTKVDRPNGSLGLETASLIAPSAGEYVLQIQIHPTASVGSGRYRVTLKTPRPGVSSDEKRMAAEQLVYDAEVLKAGNTAESFRLAIPKYERAQKIWSEIGEPYEEAIALYGAGVSYRSLGKNQAAISAFKPALELMRKAENRHGIAAVSAGAGWSYNYLNQLDQALESFQQSLAYRQGLRDISGEGLTYYGMGWVYVLRGENQQALENFEKALRLRKEAGEKRGEAVTRIGLGKIYARLKRYDESRSMLEQALERLRELKDRGAQADALSHLGAVGIMQRMDAEAKTRFQEALELRQSSSDLAGEAPARLGLAVLARREGALQDALAHIKRGVEIVEKLRREPPEDSENRERQMEILESLSEANTDPLATEGDDYSLRTSFFAQVQDYYEVYIDLLMRLEDREPGAGHAADALHVSERARARSLLDLLARTGANAPEQEALAQPLHVDEIQRRALDERTVLLEYALGAPEADRSFLWLVTQNSVNVYSLPKRSKIEAAAQRVYELLTVRNFNHSPQRREQIARSDARFKVAARELSQMLLGSVAGRLAGKRLLIVPQGALQFVPFAALPEPESPEAGARNIPGAKASSTQRRRPQSANQNWQSYIPLAVDHEVAIVPSASALAVIRRQTATRSPAERSLVVFADPVFSADDDRVRQLARQRSTPEQGRETPIPPIQPVSSAMFPNLNRLSVTAWEAQQIAALTSDSRIVRGFAANRDTAIDPELGKYRIIHFATHAVINPQNFNQSAIVLSQVDELGRPRNGLLSVKDIYHLKLPAELVVLSACRTGLGEDVRGEGLLGLTRGFLSSGAARVMVSLWAVEDQATAEMMYRFYRRTLGPERMTPAAALRATQVEMWREGRWAAPYYWGGFLLQGEWR
jgi:CHAT domain-containing protein/Tfp pilus assembly protein PilF